MDGFLLINKEKDMTSFDVVYKVRKKLNIKKIGHTGTLDPNTTGLLVIAIGRATKFIPIISQNKQKEYEASVTLGIHTDTYDITGKILEEETVKIINDQQLKSVLEGFMGKSTQTPPIYSAKKVNGKRLYDYARNNQDVEISKQEVEVFDINLTSRYDNENFSFNCLVSKGYYIRSLIVDIAKELNTIGTMSDLKRIKTDGFDLKDAKKIDEIELKDLISLDDVAKNIYENVIVDGKLAKNIKNGAKQEIDKNLKYPIIYVEKETNLPIAIYDIKNEEARSIMMFVREKND